MIVLYSSPMSRLGDHGKDHGSHSENLARQVKNKILLVLERDMSGDIRKWGSCDLSVIP